MASDGSDGRDRRERRTAYTAKTRSDGGRAARLAPGVDCCGSAIHSAVDGRSSMAAKRLEARSNHGNDGGNFLVRLRWCLLPYCSDRRSQILSFSSHLLDALIRFFKRLLAH